MQIFTAEMVTQVYVESREYVHTFFSTLLDVSWQNIVSFFPAFADALVAHDWSEVAVRLLILIGCVGAVYRLVRRMPIFTLKSISDV